MLSFSSVLRRFVWPVATATSSSKYGAGATCRGRAQSDPRLGRVILELLCQESKLMWVACFWVRMCQASSMAILCKSFDLSGSEHRRTLMLPLVDRYLVEALGEVTTLILLWRVSTELLRNAKCSSGWIHRCRDGLRNCYLVTHLTTGEFLRSARQQGIKWRRRAKGDRVEDNTRRAQNGGRPACRTHTASTSPHTSAPPRRRLIQAVRFGVRWCTMVSSSESELLPGPMPTPRPAPRPRSPELA